MSALVYDCFIFFNELDLLEIRLNILSEVVDKFVLVEADRTFSNKEKPFYFEENKKRYKQFLDKIIHIKVGEYPEINDAHNEQSFNNKYPESKDAWAMEYYQRNQIACGISACSPDDIILVSDLDEIPNPKIIKDYKNNGSGIYKLRQLHFSYYLNYQKCIYKYWDRARIARYKDITANNYTPQMIRDESKRKTIKNGGWHFSFLGGMEAIRYKMQSFAHQEYNNEKYINDTIEYKIRMGLPLWGKSARRSIPVKITNKTHPQYIVDNQTQYAHLIFPHISRYIVIHNTLYCLVMIPLISLFGIVKKIAKKILPKSIVLKLKKSVK